MTQSHRGYFFVMIAALLWALSGTAGKYLFLGGMSPFVLVQVRVTFAALFLAIFFALFRRDLLCIERRDIPYFLLYGGIITGLVQLSYFYAISKIQVAAAIFLQYLAPVIVALFSIMFWKERLSGLKLLALLFAIAGCYLVVGGYNIEFLQMNRIGIAWGLVSAFAFASYTLLGERGMQRYPPWTVLFYSYVFSALTLNIIHEPFNYHLTTDYTPVQLLCIAYVVLFGTLIPFGLYLTGINHIRSTRAIITATLEPISASLVAFLILGEALAPLQLAGGIFVIAAIVLLQMQREHDGLAPEVIRKRDS